MVASQGALLDELVERIERAIAPGVTKGVISDWVKSKVTDFATRRARER